MKRKERRGEGENGNTGGDRYEGKEMKERHVDRKVNESINKWRNKQEDDEKKN